MHLIPWRHDFFSWLDQRFKRFIIDIEIKAEGDHRGQRDWKSTNSQKPQKSQKRTESIYFLFLLDRRIVYITSNWITSCDFESKVKVTTEVKMVKFQQFVLFLQIHWMNLLRFWWSGVSQTQLSFYLRFIILDQSVRLPQKSKFWKSANSPISWIPLEAFNFTYGNADFIHAFIIITSRDLRVIGQSHHCSHRDAATMTIWSFMYKN